MKNCARIFLASVFLLAGFLDVLPAASEAPAQGTDIQWSEPINLSQSETQSTDPAMAADPSGGVHVVWSEETEDGSSFITYTHLGSSGWTSAIEVLSSPNSLTAINPSIAADGSGYLHLVWRGDSIHYSQAHASLAGTAQGWSPQVMLEYVQNYLDRPFILADAQDVLHVVYAIVLGDHSGIYYLRSDDHGQTWTDPGMIFKNFRSDRTVSDPRMAASRDGSLHVVWVESDYPESFPPLGVRYANSQDGGASWSDALILADGPYGDPAILARGENEIHAVWSGTAEDRFKFHRWSPNEGVTWSETFRNMELGGFQGYPALAVDSSQLLHWLMVGSVFSTKNDSLVHSEWRDEGWSPVESLLQNRTAGQNPANVAAVVALGNRLQAVLQAPLPSQTQPEGWQEEIFIMQGALASPAIEGLALPPVEAAPSSQAATPQSQAVTQPASPVLQTGSPPSQNAGSPFGTILFSSLLTIGVVLAGVLISRRQRR